MPKRIAWVVLAALVLATMFATGALEAAVTLASRLLPSVLLFWLGLVLFQAGIRRLGHRARLPHILMASIFWGLAVVAGFLFGHALTDVVPTLSLASLTLAAVFWLITAVATATTARLDRKRRKGETG